MSQSWSYNILMSIIWPFLKKISYFLDAQKPSKKAVILLKVVRQGPTFKVAPSGEVPAKIFTSSLKSRERLAVFALDMCSLAAADKSHAHRQQERVGERASFIQTQSHAAELNLDPSLPPSFPPPPFSSSLLFICSFTLLQRHKHSFP